MPSTPVSAVLMLTGQDDLDTAAIGALRGQLLPHDEVITADATSGAITSDGKMLAFSSAKAMTSAADLRDRAIAASRHPYVLLLCAHVTLGRRAVHRMRVALDQDPALPAVSALSPSAHGAQHLGTLGNGPRTEEFLALARDLSNTPPRVSPVELLDPRCLMLRADAAQQVLDVPEDGVRMAVTSGAAWMHAGVALCSPTTWPSRSLLTLAMIAKDEEGQILRAIQSARAHVDEIVIYDTGSKDATVAVARAAGARVIEGFWDDDFGAARNRALAHVKTPWVLFLDADEELVLDHPEALRHLLLTATPRAFLVEQRNLNDLGAVAMTTMPARLARVGLVHWVGSLHEQLAPIGESDPEALSCPTLEGLHLRHRGYQRDLVVGKEKQGRNAGVAREQLASARSSDVPQRVVDALTNLARSLGIAPETQNAYGDEQLRCLEEAWQLCERHPELTGNLNRLIGPHFAVLTCVRMDRLEEARMWLARFRHAGAGELSNVLEAEIALRAGDENGALSLLEALPETYLDLQRRPVSRTQHLPVVARLRLKLGLDASEAAKAAIAADVADARLDVMVEALPGGVEELALLCVEHSATGLLTSLCGQAAGHSAAARLLRAFHSAAPHLTQPLAAAALLDPDLMSLDDVVYWSAALRAAGQPQACPLARLRESGPPAKAALAGAILADVCADETSWDRLPELLDAVPAEQEDELVQLLETYAPGVAQALVRA